MTLDVRIHVRILLSHLHFDSLIPDGYSDESYCCSTFGNSNALIHMNYLECFGTEYKLVDCYYENGTYQYDEDWSVTCKNGN